MIESVHEWEYEFNRYRIAKEDGAIWVQRQVQSGEWVGDPRSPRPTLHELARLADLARPRDPRVELPGDGEEVVCRTDEGALWIAVYKKIACNGYRDGEMAWFPKNWTLQLCYSVREGKIVAWWPAPRLPEGER